MRIPVVAIVGRPNVGKSSLFNRFVGKRKAIVDKVSGITRDRLYETIQWEDRSFRLVDTGGMIPKDKGRLSSLILKQVEMAIDESVLVLFLLDVKDGITPIDWQIADLLRKRGCKVILVVNKVDTDNYSLKVLDFYELGLGEPYSISALHGLGIGDLLDRITDSLGKAGDEKEDGDIDRIKIAIVGRPNVGKSSFLNYLLQEDRVIVDAAPGTTRDSIDTLFEKDGNKFIVIDTAGIRHKSKIKEVLDVYSMSRSLESIRHSDVNLVMLDAVQGVTVEDLKIINTVEKEGKGIEIVLNKWDLVKDVRMEHYEKSIRNRARFLDYAPILFTSCLTGRNCLKAIDLSAEIFKNSSRTVKTPELNEALQEIQKSRSSPFRSGRTLKLHYITQAGIRPPKFMIFVNNKKMVKPDHAKFIEHHLRRAFDWTGSPIRLEFRNSRREM
ncbi:MAG: ribosome biogenesis GTPase Der [Nitrospirae bacterium]|nr:ribosome biogenesis GTPase Der [Nitrospirota bacterium]